MKCRKCKARVTTRREVGTTEVLACDPCWAAFIDDIETSRKDYAAMLAAGISEEIALRFIEGEVALA